MLTQTQFEEQFRNLVAIIDIAKTKFPSYINNPFKLNIIDGLLSLSFYKISFSKEKTITKFSKKINKTLTKKVVEDSIDVIKTVPINSFILSEEFLSYLDNNLLIKTSEKSNKLYFFKSLNEVKLNDIDFTFDGKILKKNKTGSLSERNRKLFLLNYFYATSSNKNINKKYLLSKTDISHIENIAYRKYFKNRSKIEIEDFISDTQVRVFQYICYFDITKANFKAFFIFVMKNIINSNNVNDYKKGNFRQVSIEIENEQGDFSQNTALNSLSSETFNSDFDRNFSNSSQKNKRMFDLIINLPLSNQSRIILRSIYNVALIGNTSIQQEDKRKKNQFKISVMDELRKTFRKDISDDSYRVYLTNMNKYLKQIGIIEPDKETQHILNEYKNGELDIKIAYEYMENKIKNSLISEPCIS
jgi:Ca2+-binding EF-hand superfamily protein/DNA-directed RNA polymerase specialized sigma24 family protein